MLRRLDRLRSFSSSYRRDVEEITDSARLFCPFLRCDEERVVDDCAELAPTSLRPEKAAFHMIVGFRCYRAKDIKALRRFIRMLL